MLASFPASTASVLKMRNHQSYRTSSEIAEYHISNQQVQNRTWEPSALASNHHLLSQEVTVVLFFLGGFQHYFKLFGIKEQQDLIMVIAFKQPIGGLGSTSRITPYLSKWP